MFDQHGSEIEYGQDLLFGLDNKRNTLGYSMFLWGNVFKYFLLITKVKHLIYIHIHIKVKNYFGLILSYKIVLKFSHGNTSLGCT